MPILRRAVFVAALCLPLSGCFVGRVAENEPLRMDTLADFKPGTTNAGDVVGKLGAPTDVVQLGKRSAYLYQYSLEKSAGLLLIIVGLFNEDRRHDRVWLFFDENGVLSHAGATLAAHHVGYALPWNTLHDAKANREADERRRADEAAAKTP